MPLTCKPLITIGLLAFIATIATSGIAAVAPTPTENDAITRTALDYIEGFYTGDAGRMERSLHPDLAKRIMRIDPATGKARLDHQDAKRLIAITEGRKGTPPPPQQQKDVTVLDVFGNAATVKIVANQWIDYLHLVKWDGEWKIVNVLWEMKPPQ
jgi:hypothetical protein